MKFVAKHLRAFWNSFKNSFLLFRKHDTLTLGAALSYYTGFSLFPIIIIVLSIAGAVLGPQTVQQEIKTQLESFMGTAGANELESIWRMPLRSAPGFLAASPRSAMQLHCGLSAAAPYANCASKIISVHLYTKRET
jgi:uncharacterized BrkB/YihY/UPF0761 family membrane protein